MSGLGLDQNVQKIKIKRLDFYRNNSSDDILLYMSRYKHYPRHIQVPGVNTQLTLSKPITYLIVQMNILTVIDFFNDLRNDLAP